MPPLNDWGGVQVEKEDEGELFGVANLLKLPEDVVGMHKILQVACTTHCCRLLFVNKLSNRNARSSRKNSLRTTGCIYQSMWRQLLLRPTAIKGRTIKSTKMRMG